VKAPVVLDVNLVNKGVRLKADLEGKPSIEIDSQPPYGAGDTMSAMELLLTSLCGCSGGTVLAILNKMRKTVVHFSIHAEGTRRQQPPTSFETIHLKFMLVSPDTSEAEFLKTIHLAEENYCPVWAMIRGNVEVVTEAEVSTK
jgi:putative redox protein